MRELPFNMKQLFQKRALIILLLSFALAFLYYLLQAHIGLEYFSDEGFLWYGSVATAGGQVPLRDFQSYEPGRYYWSAAWSFILGDEIKSLRLSVALFQGIGLLFGLLAIRRVIKSWPGLLLASLLLVIWMYPRHKYFEHSIAMMGVYFAVLLLENPCLKRHFIAGVFIGLAAFFGRNHGLYNFLGFGLLILFIWYKTDRNIFIKRFFIWGCGILVGYSPMFFMLAFIPGFWESFWDSVLFYARHSTPVGSLPWPWTVDLSLVHWGTMSFYNLALGIFYLFVIMFYILAASVSLISPREQIFNRRLLIASVFIGIFYMHLALFGRDWSHMAQAIHPMLIAILSIPSIFFKGRSKRLVWAIIGAGFLIMTLPMVPLNPLYPRLKFPELYVRYDLGGDRLMIREKRKTFIECVKQIDKKLFKKDDAIFIAPHWPAFYVILKRPSPVWEIYFLLPISKDIQSSMIAELEEKNVRWIMLGDVPFWGKDENRFRNSHAVMYRHIMENYAPVNVECLGKDVQLLQRKNKDDH
jgi:hypothetical protein